MYVERRTPCDDEDDDDADDEPNNEDDEPDELKEDNESDERGELESPPRGFNFGDGILMDNFDWDRAKVARDAINENCDFPKDTVLGRSLTAAIVRR